MGSTARHIRSISAVAAVTAVGLGLAGCAGGDDDDASSATATEEAQEPAARDGFDADAGSLAGGEIAPDVPTVAGAAPADVSADATADLSTLQVPGQAIAIEARATLEADDVKAAVNRVTTTVTTRGGRVAAADVDYGRPDDDGLATDARATLVLEIPPGDLPAVVTALEELGTVLSFDQFAEDVTDQLADLDTRIDNMRASVERVRALYAEAVDIDSVVRLEAELTRRETDLEVLLATQSAIEDRVTMSTLTLDVTATPAAGEVADDDDPGIVDAAAAGWGAFVGGLFAIVLVLAAIAPFAIAALVLALVALAVHRRIVRRRPEVTTSGVSPREHERPRKTTASRPG